MSNKLTYEKVKYFIEIESGSGCKLLSEEYIDAKQLLNFECKCGNTFSTNFNCFKSRNQRHCKECGKKIKSQKVKLDYNYVKNFIEKDISEWKMLKLLSSKYINAHDKLDIEDIDGYKYNVSFSTIVQNFNRKQDFNKFNTNNNFTIQNIKLWLKINKINYKLISIEYVKKKDNLLWECPEGHIFQMSFDGFYSSKRCSICSFKSMAKNMTKTHQEFVNEIHCLVGDEYSVIGTYTKSTEKILMRHNICGYEWSPLASNFINGSRCPRCAESKGEQKIRYWLQDNNINFKQQYYFLDLKSDLNNPLKFDFAIFDKNNLFCLIEFDGDFHFRKVYKNDKSEIVWYHDKLKNEYCKINNKNLLRIPYWDYDNVETILNEKLKTIMK